MATDNGDGTITVTSIEEAEIVGFLGTARHPDRRAYRGILKGVSVNTNDAPTPYLVTGPGAVTDVSEDDKKGT
jgi:hypothetical protein